MKQCHSYLGSPESKAALGAGSSDVCCYLRARPSLAAMSIWLLVLFSACDKDNPTKPEEAGWYSLGFENHKAYELEMAWPFLYACSGRDGLFRNRIRQSDAEWEYLGLSHADMADTTFEASDYAILQDVVVLENRDILAGLVAFTPWFHGLYRSSGAGGTWERSDAGIPDTLCPYESNVFSLEKSSCNPNVCFAATTGTIYRSEDGGRSWDRMHGYVCGGLGISDVQIHPKDCNITWAGGETNRFQEDLRRSTDGGRTWEWVDIAQVVPHDNAIYTIALDPFDAQVAYFGMLRGAIRTTDGGETWESPAFTWDPEGHAHSIVFDERRRGHLLVAARSTIYESWDGGDTAQVLQSPNTTLILDMEYDSRRQTLYVGTTAGVYKYVSP